MTELVFKSFFLGGFECSTHRRHDRRRLDVLYATRHDEMAETDYRLLKRYGIETVRDGFRWHRIERMPGYYDWSSIRPMLQAAKQADVQVIWDLFHYGWPDHLDIWSLAFVDRFARYAAAAARLVREETGRDGMFAIINEISFMAWAGGEFAVFNPHARNRGGALKQQLARAAIAACEAIRTISPGARLVHVDPIIHVHSASGTAKDIAAAGRHNQAQFEAWDMIAGLAAPELGGKPEYLDVMGVNYYAHNQWVEGREGPIDWQNDDRYRPLRDILHQTYERYRRPIFIAETGIEAELRPAWLRYVCEEARAAMAMGVPLSGICLYPVMNHPGWDDDRHCPNGLIDYNLETFLRSVDEPMARELAIQQALFEAVKTQPLQTQAPSQQYV